MKKALFLTVMLLFLAQQAYAGIPVLPGDYTGSRSTTPAGSGIDATGGYTLDRGGLKVAWEIGFDGTYWNYSYTFTNADGSSPISPDMSHWILEISPDIPFSNISDFIFDANATVVTPPGGSPWPADPLFPNQTQQGANGGSPNLGTNLYGVKFDTASNAVSGKYTFKSTEPPIWGDFYVK